MQSTNNPLILIVIIAIFVAIIAYAIFSKIKRRGASWTGTVIDKSVSQTTSSPTNNDTGPGIHISNNAVNTNYQLRIKGDSGEEFNWPVGEGFYTSVNVGDKLSKSPGTETPTKVSAAPATPSAKIGQ